MKRSALKIAAMPILPVLAFLLPAGPAAADPVHFEPAQVNGSTPGCSGKVTAEVSASPGQQARENANFIDSSARVTVNFTPDANPLGSISGSPGDCEISATVTMRNLDTGASTTDTRTTEYDGHYGWHAAFFTLDGAGRVAVQVSTNPTPAELTIEVPAPQ
ncbi:hypothetical protein BJY24_005069 [Nocardia transvalensis]|uniref:Uncharacterized protein n=1 Tax=Nocardia transvalensis TaxID=37333 RepID=A0A7W9UKB3_9NOCA|nr:hypothetical protein [Nocardia transvalensis]MBB5916157.1 hypothetical protein [Nocardia transvalensis]